HYAVTGQTAAELIVSRASAEKPNMNLTSWKGSIVRKQDIFIAKNYLTHDEIDTLNRLVVIFLESAELRAKNRMDITIDFWRENVDRILDFQDKKIVTNAGSISKVQMEKQVAEIYANFDKGRKEFEALQADNEDLEELKKLEQEIKTKKKE
ncbi:MAG: virulence RhuM family protein, partial [Bacteroidales bacterium]|nr:virulence RhuM family protein [Bacteroidales bacterium]